MHRRDQRRPEQRAAEGEGQRAAGPWYRWPETRIIVRGDAGCCRQQLIRGCGRAGACYLIGLARNSRLEATVSVVEMAMREAYERTRTKQREIGEFRDAAASWDRERRVLTRLEYDAQGVNPRFVVD